MDDRRFDALARSLAGAPSRRGLLRAALGGALGGLLGARFADTGAAVACPNAPCTGTYAQPCPGPCVCLSFSNGNSRCVAPSATTCSAAGQKLCNGACIPKTSCCAAADCPAPSDPCLAAACTGGTCGTTPRTGVACDDGDACTVNDVCQADGTCAGTPMDCPAGEACVNGACAPICLPLQSVCDATAPTCCQDQPTDCSFEANCTTEQGQARCCRPLGAACGTRCDCCSNADCVDGRCGVPPGGQCVEYTECAEFGSECCDGICRTLANDPANCGACGRVCPAPPPGAQAVCETFNCRVACPDGRTFCDGACVNTQTNDRHCGACGNACPDGQACCSGRCINVLDDETNCGSCGYRCGPEETCCDRFCVHTQFDVAHCGACGSACPGAESTDCVACCNSVCTNICEDFYNCGECGRQCPLGHECVGGGICLLR